MCISLSHDYFKKFWSDYNETLSFYPKEKLGWWSRKQNKERRQRVWIDIHSFIIFLTSPKKYYNVDEESNV